VFLTERGHAEGLRGSPLAAEANLIAAAIAAVAASRQTRIDRILDALAFEPADEGKDGCEHRTTAADAWNHDGYRAGPKRAAKGSLSGSPDLCLPGRLLVSIGTFAVRTSHAKLALRRSLDYFKQHVGWNIPNRGRE
jgi:hypothetical protein